jgi:hypothetical protein
VKNRIHSEKFHRTPGEGTGLTLLRATEQRRNKRARSRTRGGLEGGERRGSHDPTWWRYRMSLLRTEEKEEQGSKEYRTRGGLEGRERRDERLAKLVKEGNPTKKLTC